MHDLGLIVYYADDEGLREFVVLNPEWLTKAISYVLADKLTRDTGGVLDHARLKQIWSNRQEADIPSYPDRYHPYFLRLMEKFDVSYRLEDDQYRSLIAQLVPYDRPDLPWDSDSGPNPFSGNRHLALVCRLSEPVPGLIAWLTVRHHRASTGLHWRNGVFLRHPIAEYASEALMELRTADQLVVVVRAPSPDYFFNVLRDSIEDLMMRRWPGLNYELLIPCPSSYEGSSCPSVISMKGLMAYREEGETHYRCMVCRTRHDLSTLLTGFSQPTSTLQAELDRLSNEVTDVKRGVDDLTVYASDSANSIRRVLGAVSSEVTDCPRLFTLSPAPTVGVQRLKFYQRHYRLVLWCEHPGFWHPWPAASYSFQQPKDWLVRVGPYVTLVVTALQLVAPIAVPTAALIATGKHAEAVQNELKLMNALISDLPSPDIDRQSIIDQFAERPLTQAQGEALRGIRAVILEHDRMRAFGDLRRVQSPAGDFLWVCPEHYIEYDPGLPRMP